MKDKPRGLILLELNEVNFDLVRTYLKNFPGKFTGLEKLLDCTCINTSSEIAYHELEPWIQWASVHTGQSYSEHKIFRLGDIVGSQHPQFFEQLEYYGVSVGAISPMNAENRLKNPAYFIPDPWTNTPTDGSWWSRHLGAAISQVVNDNAQSRITKKNGLVILIGLIRFSKIKHYPIFFRFARKCFRSPWRKALILDLFLHDLHSTFVKNKRPQFSTLFLNSGAHIQHHYFHSSPYVSEASGISNPKWYISPELDPIYEMLELYDSIIGEYLKSSTHELLVATGLSQRPYDRIKYYYRLKNHTEFLHKIGINFLKVYPRMTRDFLITFASDDDAKVAEDILGAVKIHGKEEFIFGEIHNRGSELFVTLTYPDEIFEVDVVKIGAINWNLFFDVAFVAIKNGMHQEKGYAFFTSGIEKYAPKDGSHVKSLHSTVLDYFQRDQ